jgi:hypothetical protein
MPSLSPRGRSCAVIFVSFPNSSTHEGELSQGMLSMRSIKSIISSLSSEKIYNVASPPFSQLASRL